jgi:hypothetical protein
MGAGCQIGSDREAVGDPLAMSALSVAALWTVTSTMVMTGTEVVRLDPDEAGLSSVVACWWGRRQDPQLLPEGEAVWQEPRLDDTSVREAIDADLSEGDLRPGRA